MKVALIGCGAHARAAHGPALRKCARSISNTILSACCDLDAVRAERFSRDFGFDRHYGNVDQMLEREMPDALVLVAPPETTCDLACRILECRIPLLVENPPGMNVPETDRMMAAAGRDNVPVMVAVNARFMPLMGALKRRLAAEPEGSLQHIDYEFVRVDCRDVDFASTAFHGIDAVRFMAGADYEALRFVYRPIPGEPAAFNVFMGGTMTNGVTVRLRYLPVSGAVLERVSLYTADRLYRLNMPVHQGLDGPGRLLCLERGLVREERLGPPAVAGNFFESSGYFGEVAAFLETLKKGLPPAPDLAAVRQSVSIMSCFREQLPEYRAG
jgi:myo-inositol 2-dehydrogenase / D-chiro-inositol 1-dehydrogenase